MWQKVFVIAVSTLYCIAIGCNKKPIKYQLCTKQGTVENILYRNGVPYGISVLESSMVEAVLQYIPDIGGFRL